MNPPLTATVARLEMEAGRATPKSLLENCLRRIEQLEPELKAWVIYDADVALQAAEKLHRIAARGQTPGLLHGVPVGVKDIIDVQGFPTRCGSPLTDPLPCARDAPLVARLRAAGAIVLGKTVTTEFACFDPPPTRNPWNLARTPGGSSSGSAAAVAAGMIPLAIGTQTGGSVTRPASYCGVASCKPTFGRIDRAGVFPVSDRLDHVGVFARRVGDLALLLNVLQEDFCEPLPLEWDATSVAPRLVSIGPYFLEEAEPATRAVVGECVARLVAAGAEVVSIDLHNDFAQARVMHRRIMAFEAARVHCERFANSPTMFGPWMASLLREGLALSPPEYEEALRHQRRFTAEIVANIPAGTIVLTPATPASAPDVSTTGDARFNSPWSYCGLPTISLPCGLDDAGLPLAVQLVAAPWSEAGLFAAAVWIERVLRFSATPPLV